MLEALRKLFGFGPKVDLGELIRDGAIIVDVRTKGEYSSGHVKGSINIPLDQLGSNLAKLKKDKVIITCCASGMRSGVAKSQLKGKGYENVYNGGSCANLNQYVK